MTLASASANIFNKLQSSWGTITLVSWPNHPFVAPDDVSWIRPVIKVPITSVAELGTNGLGLRDGLLMISIFTPKESGSIAANILADRLEAIFRRVDVGEIWFDEPNSNPIGNDPNGYYHVLMTVDFHMWVN